MNFESLFADKETLISILLVKDTDMFAQAEMMQVLCTRYNYTQASLAKALGVSQSCIGNKIRLLQFSSAERELILSYRLSERHARALLRVKPPKREKLISTAGGMHLSVQQTEELVEKCCAAPQSCTQSEMSINLINADTYIRQTQHGAERLRAVGYRTTYMTESGEGWQRITVTIME